MLSAKHRDFNLQSYDDISSLPSGHHRNSGGSKTSRKSHSGCANSLPIPKHARAASTPVHIEKQTTIDLKPQHRRFPSCVESTPRHNTSDPGLREDAPKKFSLDHFAPRHDDRDAKRASSEVKELTTSKRNTSSPAAISLLNFTNEKLQKLNFDELNRKTSSQSKHKTSLKATPELLAELLKGSSEKMVTCEQTKKSNNRSIGDHSNTLPTAVLKFLVSIFHFHLLLPKHLPLSVSVHNENDNDNVLDTHETLITWLTFHVFESKCLQHADKPMVREDNDKFKGRQASNTNRNIPFGLAHK